MSTSDTHGFRPIGTLPTRIEWRGATVLARDETGRACLQLRDDIDGIAAPAQWSVFGGEVEKNETLIAAASREFAEETGVHFSESELRPLAKFASQATSNGVIYVFEATRPIAPEDIRLGEGAGFGFLTDRQIESYPLIPNVAAMFRELRDI